MRIRLQVGSQRPGTAEPTTSRVVVEAAPGMTAAALAAALAPLLLPSGEALALRASGRVVDPTLPLGMPPLLDGAPVTLARGDEPVSTRHTALTEWELHVEQGPRRGLRFPLPLGATVLSRSDATAIALGDLDVSRVHAEIRVDDGAVHLRDLGSANGTWVGAEPVSATPVPVRAGDRIRVGTTVLQLAHRPGSPGPTRADGRGHLLVNRVPRVQGRAQIEPVRFPDSPTPPARSSLPVLAMVIPLALSGVLALVMRSPTMLLFGLMGPALAAGTWVSERRRGPRKRAKAAHDAAVEEAQTRLDAAVDAERDRLLTAHPGLADVLRVAQRRAPTLWERRRSDDDALVVRLGLGPVDSHVPVTGDERPVDPPRLRAAPVLLSFSDHPVVGLVGRRAAVVATAGAVVGRWCVAHSPLDVRVLVVTGPGRVAPWEWVELLPHAGDDADAVAAVLVHDPLAPATPSRPGVGALEAVLESRRTARDTAPFGAPAPSQPEILVVLDGAAALRELAPVAALLRDGPSLGMRVLALESTRERLPVETSCVVAVTEAGEGAVESSATTAPATVALDQPSPQWPAALADALAPLRDATPRSGVAALPRTVRLLEVQTDAGADGTSTDEASAQLAESWAARPRSTELTVGAGVDGVVRIDLLTDGPHALIGGTTGSGKSELLQSLIASLALGNRPDELAFVLVDYKGGAAFRDCERLPHAVGVVTDLDEHLTARALVSLHAEIRRRERLLADAGAKDLTTYQERWRADPHTRPRIPRLVIVVDEFRNLAEELPDFVPGLVRLAAVGRSLGIHLILATQRPGGIVSADIRANVSLRIGLRMRDRADSTDVLESPDAAAISADTPGRGVLRGAATPLTPFQTARVAGVASLQQPLTVTPVDSLWRPLDRAGPVRGNDPVSSFESSGRTDLAHIVEVTHAAAVRLGIPQGASPWLPPLPAALPAEDLLAAGRGVALGLVDDPERQDQRVLTWDPAAGHLGIAGGPRSGRTTALRTIAAGLATRYSPDELHLYACGAADLEPLAALPHTAAVTALDDSEHLALVLARLREVVRRPVGEALSVLMVDGWDTLAALDHGATEAILALARAGGPSTFRLVVTGERALLAGQLTSLLTTRLVLRLADPLGYTLAGIPTRSLPREFPPGRGMDAATHLEVQLASPDGAWPAPHRWGSDVHGPAPVRRLGAQVPLSALDGSRPGLAAVAVRAGDLEPVGFAPSQGHRRIVVVGPPRSGRTTALAVLATQLLRLGHPVAVVDRQLAALLDAGPADRVHLLTPEDRDLLIALRTAQPDLAVLVDDAECLVGSPIEAVVREIGHRADEAGGLVAVSGSAATWGPAYGSVPLELARARTGLVLGSDPADAILLSLPTGLRPPGPRAPGRGLLVVDGAAEAVQIALPQRAKALTIRP